jgi:hypothetical protein
MVQDWCIFTNRHCIEIPKTINVQSIVFKIALRKRQRSLGINGCWSGVLGFSWNASHIYRGSLRAAQTTKLQMLCYIQAVHAGRPCYMQACSYIARYTVPATSLSTSNSAAQHQLDA